MFLYLMRRYQITEAEMEVLIGLIRGDHFAIGLFSKPMIRILELYFVSGKTLADIATVLGLPAHAVRNRFTKGVYLLGKVGGGKVDG
jgi:hypothetical protein